MNATMVASGESVVRLAFVRPTLRTVYSSVKTAPNDSFSGDCNTWNV